MSTLARQYHKQIADQTLPKNKTRLEILRRLELIAQSIKGLMKYEQERMYAPRPSTPLTWSTALTEPRIDEILSLALHDQYQLRYRRNRVALQP